MIGKKNPRLVSVAPGDTQESIDAKLAPPAHEWKVPAPPTYRVRVISPGKSDIGKKWDPGVICTEEQVIAMGFTVENHSNE